ncbi:hypothetical protein [Halomonas sp. GD1P12]|uniref:hypothetical protein n=1 Tax=Halomonas sp. GD1P12 TaxID=2982691 RepID=UPI0021E5027C|nr:hypothetical protein [Halomonas sp. GD1P12]UYF99353.1 hypothetical protein OCT39_14110 [Halomonas sp. GD1P12]
MSYEESSGFFCELKPITVANNIASDLKLVNNYYFKVVGHHKFKVMGYNANGLMKEGEAELVKDDEFDQDDIQGSFIENNKEIKFKIEPLNLFKESVFFGSGVWIEYGENNNPRQKYNIRIWDASFYNQDPSFLNQLFGVNKELESRIHYFNESFKKQEVGLTKLSKQIEDAYSNMQSYNEHSDSLAESLAEAKNLLKNVNNIHNNLEKNRAYLDILIGDNEKLTYDAKSILEKAAAVTSASESVQKKADEVLGSAVTVQLAKSFKERKEAAAALRVTYDIIFYASLGVGLIIALSLFAWSDFEPNDFWSYVHFFLTRLTLFGVPLWLGVFASKKSSLLTRLEEFYAQKQTLAESYEGYKSRLLEIGDEVSEDLKELMRINLLSISRDSQMVIDGAAKEKHSPIEQLLLWRKNKESE